MGFKKKILFFLSLVFILAITGGVYWYFNIFKEPVRTAEKTVKKYLEASLKPEFLPPEIRIKQAVDIGGGVTSDRNTYGYNWNISEKNFYTTIDYNNEKPGINAYILTVSWDEKIDLDQETAQELLENYFNLGRTDLKCKTVTLEAGIINFCQGSWQDQEKNWCSLSVISGYQAEKDYTLLIYYLTPLESETYGEKPFQ